MKIFGITLLAVLLPLSLLADDGYYLNRPGIGCQIDTNRVYLWESQDSFSNMALATIFDKDYGTNTIDYSGYRNDGIGTNVLTTPSWSNSNGRGCCVFNGSDDAWRILATDSLTNFNSFTIFTWVQRFSNNTYDWIFIKGGGNTPTKWREWQFYFLDSDTLACNVFDDAGGDNFYIGRTGPCEAVADWTHVAMTFDGTNTIRLYRNGVRVDNADSAAGVFDARYRSTEVAHLGVLVSGGLLFHYMHGAMSQIRLYTSVFASNDVYNMYLRGRQ